jgi:hypothetical protein
MLKAWWDEIGDGGGSIVSIIEESETLTIREVLAGWRGSEPFRDLFVAELAASPYRAFFWEMPPVSLEVLTNPFECAVIGSEALAGMRADDSDFAEYLIGAADSVASFPNLGGDALLIAPSKISNADCYAHFAAFLRGGPRGQQHALFHLLATETENLLNAGRRFWISTSGLGVPWVHVRLDTSPKYYQYRPYADG